MQGQISWKMRVSYELHLLPGAVPFQQDICDQYKS